MSILVQRAVSAVRAAALGTQEAASRPSTAGMLTTPRQPVTAMRASRKQARALSSEALSCTACTQTTLAWFVRTQTLMRSSTSGHPRRALRVPVTRLPSPLGQCLGCRRPTLAPTGA